MQLIAVVPDAKRRFVIIDEGEPDDTIAFVQDLVHRDDIRAQNYFADAVCEIMDFNLSKLLHVCGAIESVLVSNDTLSIAGAAYPDYKVIGKFDSDRDRICPI